MLQYVYILQKRQTIQNPEPFPQIGSKNSLNPGGIPLTVSQEYPPSGSRKGRCRSRLSSSWMPRPSRRIRLSAEAFAAVTAASIKSCSEDDKYGSHGGNISGNGRSSVWIGILSFCDKASGKQHSICLL